MRFAFTSDRELLRDALRDVLKRECPPAVVRAAWDSERGVAEPLWKTLSELGVVGLTVPEAHGGMGLGALDWVLLFEECGRAAMPAPLADTMAVGVPLLGDVASAAVAARWLSGVAKGDVVLAVGLEGAPFVLNAHVADLLLLQRGEELHAVPRGEVTLEEQRSVDRARRLFRVTWTPREATRLATGAACKTAVADAYDRGALAASAELVGLARQMVDMTVDYAKVRKQFGAAIGSFQAVKHHLASALVKIELARPVVYRAADSVARGDRDRAWHVSMAKACASEAALLAARVALQCHGAIGYSFEHDLHLWMKRAWALASAWGDAAHHRARVASAVGINSVTSASGERS